MKVLIMLSGVEILIVIISESVIAKVTVKRKVVSGHVFFCFRVDIYFITCNYNCLVVISVVLYYLCVESSDLVIFNVFIAYLTC